MKPVRLPLHPGAPSWRHRLLGHATAPWQGALAALREHFESPTLLLLTPGAFDFVSRNVSWGAGPRASQYLVIGAKARAILSGRFAASVEDVRALARPVLRHRVLPNFTAESAHGESVNIMSGLGHSSTGTPTCGLPLLSTLPVSPPLRTGPAAGNVAGPAPIARFASTSPTRSGTVPLGHSVFASPGPRIATPSSDATHSRPPSSASVSRTCSAPSSATRPAAP